MMNKIKTVLLISICSFLGGMTAQLLIQPSRSWASYLQDLIGSKLEIQNSAGFQTADIFTPANAGGILDLYSNNGSLRFQAGSYDSGGERGLPFAGFSDNQAKLRMLLRLAGGNESPVFIMKDKAGHDRMVMGLDMSTPDQEPFLAVIDKNGNRKNIFGNYR